MKKKKSMKNRRSYWGKGNPNWRHGKAKCQKCGKELSEYTYKLCRKCYLSTKIINIPKEKLIVLYVSKKLSMRKIGNILSCSEVTIFNYLYKYDIPTRGKTEGYDGKGNPNYKDGLSKLPYPFEWTETLRESIRQRDNYTCQLCDKTQGEARRKLSVHHIDYDKDNLDPENLITLCCSCNGKVNSNRLDWIKYFTTAHGWKPQ